MRRRAEAAVVAVDLRAGGAAKDQAEIADPLLGADAVEDPGGARIEAAGLAAVEGRGVEALGNESHADQALRRAAEPQPQPAGLAGEAVVVLARLGGPGPRPGFAAADLDHGGVVAAEGGA